MIAQHGYGPSTTPRLRYEALTIALRAVAAHALTTKATVHAPRIGAGEARGTWSIIEELIEDNVVASGVPVTIYDLPGAPRPRPAAISEKP